MSVAQLLGRVLQSAFEPKKVGLLIGGLDVAYTHIHLVPIETVHDLDDDRQQTDPADADLDDAAEIRGSNRLAPTAQASRCSARSVEGLVVTRGSI
jgi:hypothetical protein